MKNLSLIAAIGKSKELGLDNHLLWHIPEDLKFYKDTTWGKNVIVGSNTLLSMPPKAFENRKAFVLSHKKIDNFLDVYSFNNIDSLLQLIKDSKEEFIVIGGASIYKQFLPYVDTMYLTEINEYFYADTFFPEVNLNDWDVTLLGKYSYNDLDYVRNKYTRRRIK